MNVLSYKGFQARIDYDAEDGLLVGRIAGINDVVGFHASTPGEVETAFREAVEDYVATCERIGKAPEKPYSGKLMLRGSAQTHAGAARAAALAGQSLNQWSEEALRAAIETARRELHDAS